MARNRVQCMGRQDERCVCDMCLDTKMQMLRQAPPDVQRSILMYLPPDNLHTVPPPAVLHCTPSSNNLNATQLRSPNGTSFEAPSDGDGVGESPSTGPGQLHALSLFKVPLWPTRSDAEFEGAPTPLRRAPSTPGNIVIPPLVQQCIPTIKDCIDYVMNNSNISGPRKEAAILESIDEILAICERKLGQDLPTNLHAGH